MKSEKPHIGPVSELESQDLEKGAWIGLLNCHKSPPHLVFVDGGIVYSLEHESCREYHQGKLFKLILQKKKPSIFFKLSVQTENQTKAVFSRYQKIDKGQTCLNPIKELLALLGIVHLNDVEYVYQLIPELNAQNQLTEIKGHLVTTNPSNNHFYFQIYTKKEIFDRIEKLNDTVDQR